MTVLHRSSKSILKKITGPKGKNTETSWSRKVKNAKHRPKLPTWQCCATSWGFRTFAWSGGNRRTRKCAYRSTVLHVLGIIWLFYTEATKSIKKNYWSKGEIYWDLLNQNNLRLVKWEQSEKIWCLLSRERRKCLWAELRWTEVEAKQNLWGK